MKKTTEPGLRIHSLDQQSLNNCEHNRGLQTAWPVKFFNQKVSCIGSLTSSLIPWVINRMLAQALFIRPVSIGYTANCERFVSLYWIQPIFQWILWCLSWQFSDTNSEFKPWVSSQPAPSPLDRLLMRKGSKAISRCSLHLYHHRCCQKYIMHRTEPIKLIVYKVIFWFTKGVIGRN